MQSWDTAIRTDERNSYSVCITLLVQDKLLRARRYSGLGFDLLQFASRPQSSFCTYKPDQIVVEDSGFGKLDAPAGELGHGAIPFRPRVRQQRAARPLD